MPLPFNQCCKVSVTNVGTPCSRHSSRCSRASQRRCTSLAFIGTVLFQCDDDYPLEEQPGRCYPCLGPSSAADLSAADLEDYILDFYRPICGDDLGDLSEITEDFLLQCRHGGGWAIVPCTDSATSDDFTASEDDFTTSEDSFDVCLSLLCNVPVMT